ncbi:leukocyte elastase inhibitor-like [Ixodes scapularis]|uniref:leukocyte elastase inhibitor-like n=1 Tax=Ixodes scapularis TaxID=6945 RepID=UPI001C38A84E|nr:leukocyte elastase inhibitor-like [Ixodes scapularis]
MAAPPASEPDRFNALAASVFLAARNGASDAGKNLVCSPLGVVSALAAAQAASGEASGASSVAQLDSNLRVLLACDSLRMGNLMHVDQATTLREDYQTLFESEFAGKVRVFDSKKDISATTDLWASQLTDGVVRSVFGFPDEDVARTDLASAAAGEMCLVNLVEFCGCWEQGFTRFSVQPFYVKPDQATMVPMMSQRNEFAYVRDSGYRCLRVPYECEAQLVLFVPSEMAGLDAILPSLSSWDQLKAVLDQAIWTTGVTLTLPKVQLESRTLDLRQVLRDHELGALLKGAGPAEPVGGDPRLGGVYHKAALNLSEGGPDRAPLGFSALLSLSSPIPPNKPIHFVVDRPFMFLLIKKGFLVMMGLVRDLEPRKEQDKSATSCKS